MPRDIFLNIFYFESSTSNLIYFIFSRKMFKRVWTAELSTESREGDRII